MSEKSTEDISCPLCEYEGNKPYKFERFEGVLLGLNRCARCSLIYVSPRLSERSQREYYDLAYTAGAVSGAYNIDPAVSEHEYKQFVDYMNRYVPSAGRVLDVGCGVGNLLKMLRSHGSYTLMGVEPSAYAAREAQRSGLSVLKGELSSSDFAEESFDGVTLLYVLEHVRDPRELLLSIRRILKPSGYLLLAVPNYHYLKLVADNPIARVLRSGESIMHTEEHLQNFTPRTLRQLVGKCGYTVEASNCAKPLGIGNRGVRTAKNLAFLVAKTLQRFGYLVGGIHFILRRQP